MALQKFKLQDIKNSFLAIVKLEFIMRKCRIQIDSLWVAIRIINATYELLPKTRTADKIGLPQSKRSQINLEKQTYERKKKQ